MGSWATPNSGFAKFYNNFIPHYKQLLRIRIHLWNKTANITSKHLKADFLLAFFIHFIVKQAKTAKNLVADLTNIAKFFIYIALAKNLVFCSI